MNILSILRHNIFQTILLLTLLVFPLQSGIALDNWQVREHQGAPCLFRNGQPVTPFIFWQWEPVERDIKDMSQAGVKLFSFFGSTGHYANPFWRKDQSFAMTWQDQHLRNLLQWNPEALVMPRIFATVPNWWIQQHPEEQIQYTNGLKANSWGTTKNNARYSRESFASQKAMNENGPMFRKAIRHLIDQYDRHLFGIHVTNGPAGENFSWDAYLLQHPQAIPTPAGDQSEPMRLEFVRYLREKYKNDPNALRKAYTNNPTAFKSSSTQTNSEIIFDFNSVRIPDRKERLKLTDGAWRNPSQNRWVPDYFECHNKTTVKMLDYYCGIVKQESAEKLPTLVFYGYTQDENWALEADHRAVNDIYQSSNVDMFSAPHTYYRRGLGEDGLFRHYFSSAALHGKLFIDEGDDQTHLEMRKPRPDSRCYARSMADSKALLYREFGNMATFGTGLWYMDLGKGWFHDPELVDTVAKMKKWADVSMKHSRKRASQIAVISAPQSEFYLGYRKTPANEISYGLYHQQLGEFFRAGAPFDWFLIDDLDAVINGNYKVCVFLDCFFMTDRQRQKIESMKSNNRTLVWFFAPGYVSENDLSITRMEKMTGFKFKKNATGKLRGKANDGHLLGIDRTQNSIFSVRPEKEVSAMAYGVEQLEKEIVIAKRKYQNWTSIFTAIPGLDRLELLKINKEAGVPVYIESDDILSASESWLMLHTRSAGKKSVRLPQLCKKITEITKEKVVAENTDRFEIELPQHATAIFLLEK